MPLYYFLCTISSCVWNTTARPARPSCSADLEPATARRPLAGLSAVSKVRTQEAAGEARNYNGLVVSWLAIARLACERRAEPAEKQQEMF